MTSSPLAHSELLGSQQDFFNNFNMAKIATLSHELKHALTGDAPDIAEWAGVLAKHDSRVFETLQDLEDIQKQLSAAPEGSDTAIDLIRIRAELIDELRRTVAKLAVKAVSQGRQ